ncbi:hypothetical protein Tco_0409867 [Tanacetum coccineum]
MDSPYPESVCLLGGSLTTVHLCRSVISSIETARIFDFEEFPVKDKDDIEIPGTCEALSIAILPKRSLLEKHNLAEMLILTFSPFLIFLPDTFSANTDMPTFSKKGKKKLLIFKVDFEKAFDSISWNYLIHILDSFGFGKEILYLLSFSSWLWKVSIMLSLIPTVVKAIGVWERIILQEDQRDLEPSTFYGGKVMPTWIRRRRKGPSISFTIPSSPNKLRGLNLSYVQTLIRPYWRSKEQYENFEYPDHQFIKLPDIKIRNITKNLTWLYTHHIRRVNVGGKSLTFLSHWMFGENEMEDGDQLTISIKHDMIEWEDDDRRIRECGVSFVYDDGKNEKEEDPLSYYKSWNHIIGGDLSPFQLTTQEYFLNSFMARCSTLYKDKERIFKAFSQKNSNTRGRAIEVYEE